MTHSYVTESTESRHTELTQQPYEDSEGNVWTCMESGVSVEISTHTHTHTPSHSHPFCPHPTGHNIHQALLTTLERLLCHISVITLT